ncbi:winged helix-turn-helix domain-containing protein [Paenibacillus phyllosphaerae]|nr:winged helix-turn-helix domain-containing protein [Paenibacillus phyllosphaerae]
MPSHASADTGELSRSLATDGGAWGNGNGYAAHASPHQAEKRPSEASRSADEQHVGPFRLSTAKRRLWKSGEEVILTPTEWTLMKLLMDREGEGLSRDEILNAVWGRHFIGDLKIVDVNIRRIRQKIEATPSHPVYIETLWGYGYRFNRGDEG